MSDDRLSELFKRQERLQNESFNHSLREMTPSDRIEYIRWNVLALEDELHEALAETPWKPWSKSLHEVDETRYFKELTDALHFLMNLWLVFVPAEEAATLMFDLYTQKSELNAKRQAQGYDGVSTKCPSCRRALDEPGAIRTVRNTRARIVGYTCVACNFSLDMESLTEAGLVT